MPWLVALRQVSHYTIFDEIQRLKLSLSVGMFDQKGQRKIQEVIQENELKLYTKSDTNVKDVIKRIKAREASKAMDAFLGFVTNSPAIQQTGAGKISERR